MNAQANNIISRTPDIVPIVNSPCTCWHCDSTFHNMQALKAHLSHCQSRTHLKYFVCENIIFGVVLNPKRRIIDAVSNTCIDLKKAKAVVGLLHGLQQAHYIQSFFAVEHKGFLQEINHLRNGIVRADELEKQLSKEDIETLEKQYKLISTHKQVV